MRVAFWNVAGGGPRRLPLLERVDADVLLLAEVSGRSARWWAEQWAGEYHCTAALDLVDSPQQRPRGAMIASRWPLRGVRAVGGLPRAERGLIAVVEHPAKPFSLVAWSTPNAAGDGRAAKEQAYAAMIGELVGLDGLVVAGVDTNAWEDPPLGSPEPAEDPRYAHQLAFVGRDAVHGLRDAFRVVLDRDRARSGLLRAVRPDGPLAVTYIRRPAGQPRRIVDRPGLAFGLDRMDRLYASPEIEVRACESFYHEAVDAGSDHALVVADLALPGEQPTPPDGGGE